MSEIIDQLYAPLLAEHGFIRDSDNQQYGALGICWKLSPEVGEGTYWTYGQKDLYDIKIHNFSFHKDFMLECSLPECLSITQYDSISGEELSPYRRLSAGCIKTFIGGYAPYKALIHKNIPIRSVGIEIAPAYFYQLNHHRQAGQRAFVLDIRKIPTVTMYHVSQRTAGKLFCFSCCLDIRSERFKAGTVLDFRHSASPIYIL